MSVTGVKRDHNGRVKVVPDAPRGRFHDMFEGFRDELDQHHDRRERLVKVSRDVTAQSKKMQVTALPITFSMLTRSLVKELNKELPPNIQKDMDTRIAEIATLLGSIAPDLQSINRYRYQSSMRCLEELVEALSFAHYLRHQTLITPAQAQAAVPADVSLTEYDYMYGVFDLFGELMRFTTVTTAQTGRLLGGRADGDHDHHHSRTLLSDMQDLGCAFEMMRDVPTRDYRNKVEAMRQSVRKVEKLGYGLVVRGSERPKGWVPDMKEDVADHGSP
ncbi:translin-associated factor TraX [Cordyceps javanica]|uniref:Translin-associated factor TraX n=1 Tax=Cordyceps javanica TaxID=43265 RepID=A0A545W183_9HYPO|nr:translin-associated factor TraX [Cordyceps javanica]TQW07720.1 translin-associated factor TraX [Cordyceps javanica]